MTELIDIEKARELTNVAYKECLANDVAYVYNAIERSAKNGYHNVCFMDDNIDLECSISAIYKAAKSEWKAKGYRVFKIFGLMIIKW